MKTRNLILLFSIAVLFTACGGSSDPLSIAEKFAKAYCSGDYDTCNSLMEEDEFTPSKDMSDMEKAAMKHIKEESKKMQYVITPDNEDNVMDEDRVETSFVITSKKDPDFKKRLSVKLDKDDSGTWKVIRYRGM